MDPVRSHVNAVTAARQDRPPVAAFGAVIGVIFLWGTMPTVLKHFTHELDAATMIGVRYTLCALVWLPAVVKGWVQGRITRSLMRAVLLPALAFFLGQIFWSMAPYHNDASIMMFIGRSAFLFSMLFGFWLVKSERALLKHPRFWGGLLVTAIGMTVLFFAAWQEGATTVKGFAIMIAAALCWGLHGPFVKKFMDDVSAPLGFGLMTLCMLPFVLTILFTAGDPSAFCDLSRGNMLLLVFVSMVSVAMGQALSFYSFQRLGPVVVEGGYQSMPFVAAVIAFCWLGEEMSGLQWLAGVGVVLGSVLLLSTKMQRNA